jgi:hypothetical protein
LQEEFSMNVRRMIVAALVVPTLSLSVWAQRGGVRRIGGLVPEGTTVEIRMIDTITSATAKDGDIFHATLEQPIRVSTRTLYPKGSDVTGKVAYAHPSGRLSDPGELELVLTTISIGRFTYPLNTQPWTIKGESHTKSTVGKVGGGAALGAVIGAIAGGGKGAAIGAGAGAAAGTGVAAATGKKEAVVESEAVLSFVTLAPPSEPAGRPETWRNPNVPSHDDSQLGRPFKPEFTNYDRQNIRGCFADTSNLPPGLAERDSLPPGLEQQVERNGTLPPGLEKRAQPLPEGCDARLPRLPADWSRVVLGRRVLLLDPDHRIVDLFSLDDDEEER